LDRSRENPSLLKYDCEYISKIMRSFYPENEKFILISGLDIGRTYACGKGYAETLVHSFIVNPRFSVPDCIFDISNSLISNNLRPDGSYSRLFRTALSKLTSRGLDERFLKAYRPVVDRKVIVKRIDSLNESQIDPIIENSENGLNYDNIDSNVTFICSDDRSMNNAQILRQLLDTVQVGIVEVVDSKFLISLDQPERFATIVINKIQENYGPNILAQPFLGLCGDSSGSEVFQIEAIQTFRKRR